MVCCHMVGAGGEATILGFLSPLPLPSFPFLLLVKHLYARRSLMCSTHADGFMWLPKGSIRLSGAPYRFGTWKCGWEDHGRWQENMPIKRGRELPVCLWCICAFLSSLVRRLNHRSPYYLWVSFHTYCKKNLLKQKMQKTSEQLSSVEKNITSKVTSDRRSVSDYYINSKTLFRE